MDGVANFLEIVGGGQQLVASGEDALQRAAAQAWRQRPGEQLAELLRRQGARTTVHRGSGTGC